MIADDTTFKKLRGLNISMQLIKASGISEADEDLLCARLQKAYHNDCRLNVGWVWQLQLLTADFTPLKNLSALGSVKDYDGAGPGHYAAWSGQPEGLEIIFSTFGNGDWFDARDTSGRRLVHFAAWSGNPAMLDWISTHRPGLLTTTDDYGRNIADYAAWSGEPVMLDWVFEKYPELFASKMSKEKKVLDFFFPDDIHYMQWHPVNCALLSKNPHQLNKALSLSQTPRTIDFRSFISKTGRRNVLLAALENNFTLTTVHFHEREKEEVKRQITDKLIRNIRIEEATAAFKTFVQWRNQQGSDAGLLNNNILLEIFCKLLPEGISIEKIQRAFEKIMGNLSLATRLKKHKNTVNQYIDIEIKNLESARKHPYLGLIEPLEDKIELLKILQEKINNEYQTLRELKQGITDFYQDHQAIIDHQYNKLYSFFMPAQKSSTSLMFITLGELGYTVEKDLIPNHSRSSHSLDNP